eukprot:3715346-Prymnesium_polylepis.2
MALSLAHAGRPRAKRHQGPRVFRCSSNYSSTGGRFLHAIAMNGGNVWITAEKKRRRIQRLHTRIYQLHTRTETEMLERKTEMYAVHGYCVPARGGTSMYG